MARYVLTNGYRVYTKPRADGATEFTTKSPTGETISTVTLKDEDAENIRTALRINDALRFASVYGGQFPRKTLDIA